MIITAYLTVIFLLIFLSVTVINLQISNGQPESTEILNNNTINTIDYKNKTLQDTILYILFSNGTISTLDSALNPIADNMIVDREDWGSELAINPDNGYLYMVSDRSDSSSDPILTIDPDPNKNPLVNAIPLSATPQKLLLDQETGLLYVVTSDGSLSIIDTNNNNTLVGNIPIGPIPTYSSSIFSDTKNGYLHYPSGNKVISIDPDPNKNPLVDTITVGESASALSIHPKTGLLYVNDVYEGIRVIDTNNNNTIVDNISTNSNSDRILIDPDTNYLYVWDNIYNTISIIDTNNNNTLVNPTPTPIYSNQRDFTFNPINGYLYYKS